MIQTAVFAGEPVWETGARLIVGFYERSEVKRPMSRQLQYEGCFWGE